MFSTHGTYRLRTLCCRGRTPSLQALLLHTRDACPYAAWIMQAVGWVLSCNAMHPEWDSNSVFHLPFCATKQSTHLFQHSLFQTIFLAQLLQCALWQILPSSQATGITTNHTQHIPTTHYLYSAHISCALNCSLLPSMIPTIAVISCKRSALTRPFLLWNLVCTPHTKHAWWHLRVHFLSCQAATTTQCSLRTQCAAQSLC